MKLNTYLSAATLAVVAFAGSLTAAIDPDIAVRNGLALKQYAQQLKDNAMAPHHAHGAHTDVDDLYHAITDGNTDVYVTNELVKARARVTAALTTLGGDADNLLLAVVPGAGQPAGITVGQMKAALDAEMARAITTAAIHPAVPVSGNVKDLQTTIEAVDLAMQGALTPWLNALQAGAGAVPFYDAARAAAITGITGNGNTRDDFRDWLLNALITR